MNQTITIKQKAQFLQYFLNTFQLKRRESVWILNYLLNHKDVLENVHFIEGAKFKSRGMVITTACSDDVPFRFYRNGMVTTDAEKAFHDIRLNQHETLYIELSFNNRYTNERFLAILEENLDIPFQASEEDQQEAENLLELLLKKGEIKRMKDQIDKALEERDEKKFIELSDKLNFIQQNA